MTGQASLTVTADLPTRGRQWIQPVFERGQGRGQLLQVGLDSDARGRPVHTGGAGAQGVTPTVGYFDIEGRLGEVAGPGPTDVIVRTRLPRQDVGLDAVLVQPAAEWLTLAGGGRSQALVRSFDTRPATQRVTLPNAEGVTATSYDADGRETASSVAAGSTVAVRLSPGGFAIVRGD